MNYFIFPRTSQEASCRTEDVEEDSTRKSKDFTKCLKLNNETYPEVLIEIHPRGVLDRTPRETKK